MAEPHSEAEPVRPVGTRNRDRARITLANRDALREKAFALHAQGLGYVAISKVLNISKNTVGRYIKEELPRRRYDPEARDILNKVIASLKERHRLFEAKFHSIEVKDTTSANSIAKWSRAMERIERDLLFLHGIQMPKDGEELLDERARRMDRDAKQMLKETEGYPSLSEQSIIERHIGEETDQEFIERYERHPLTQNRESSPPPGEKDDGDEGEFMVQNWNDDLPSIWDSHPDR
jgi:hypothetical protein